MKENITLSNEVKRKLKIKQMMISNYLSKYSATDFLFIPLFYILTDHFAISVVNLIIEKGYSHVTVLRDEGSYDEK